MGAFALLAALLLTGCGSGVKAPSAINAGASLPSSVATVKNPPPPVSQIRLDAPYLEMLPGEALRINATILNSHSLLNWKLLSSADPKTPPGTITPDGIYTAPNMAGDVTITASLVDDPGISGALTMRVVVPPTAAVGAAIAYRIPLAARSSAAVYASSGELLKTLWSNQQDSAGIHLASWDGNRDDGSRASSGPYTVKVLYNNVQYAWSVIGDTSRSLSSVNSWDMQASFPTDATITGNTVIVANGNAEGRNNAASFDTSDPQSPSGLFKMDQSLFLQYAAADDDRVYFGNTGAGITSSRTFVLAYDLTGKQIYTFSAGTRVVMNNRVYKGVIDIDPSSSPKLGADREYISTGIAVQRHGRILAVAHGDYIKTGSTVTAPGSDMIVLYDKVTGVRIGAIAIRSPQRMAFDNDNNLWAIADGKLVKITGVSNQNFIGPAVSGLKAPLALTVDQRSGELLVADGGLSQQVKRISMDGRLMTSYGKEGGYRDCSPRVTFDRFYLDSTIGQGSGMQIPGTWLVSQPDGSFWVGELANNRALHFSGTGDYIGQFSFIRLLYYVAVDHNDPTRVFANRLEFAVDYKANHSVSEPSVTAGNSPGWSLKNNWSVCVAPTYEQGFKRVITLAGGRTYGEIRNNALPNAPGTYQYELVELPKTGPLRPTGRLMQDSSYRMYLDDSGNLSYWRATSAKAGVPEIRHAYTQPLLSVGDAPAWGPARELAAVPATSTNSSMPEPYGFGGWGMEMFPKLTSQGYLITYRSNPVQVLGAPHLGGVALGDTKWSWRASPEAVLSTPDSKGSFPQQNSYGGHNGISALVEGSSIFEGYDGQWDAKVSSQWMHWWDDGLLIGQFGHPAGTVEADGSLSPGAAGNIMSMATASVAGEIYLYNSDEGYHPGVHQWHVSGLDTIHEIVGTTSTGSSAVLHQAF